MKFFIISHATAIPGQIDYLKDYLRSKGNKCLELSHPLDVYENNATKFVDGKTVIKTIKRNKIPAINYLIDTYLSLRYVSKTEFDIFVGANNFDTLSGILGKILFHRSYKIILSADYSGKRFKSPILNSLYYQIEKIVIKYSDYVISFTKRVESERIKLGLAKAKSFVMPCVSPIKNPVFLKKTINPSYFIYVGNVTDEHGLLNLINILSPVIKKLVVIGGGSQWTKMEKIISKLKIPTDLYSEKSHEFVIKYLQKFNGFGLAPYNDSAQWTYYCSPLKIFEYVSTGTPVVTSNRTELSKYIKEKALGIVYKSNNYAMISRQLQTFDTGSYNLKAKTFYNNFKIDAIYRSFLLVLKKSINYS